VEGDGIGVLVQCMVQAVTSGVAFTVNPITGADEIAINRAHGLGEALVGGLIEPDQYILPKSDLGVVSSRKVSDVSDTSLGELGRLLMRIEQIYGAPPAFSASTRRASRDRLRAWRPSIPGRSRIARSGRRFSGGSASHLSRSRSCSS
jgi:Pyruvate phosphate dikinase, AMP/ATP-binding domain